MLPLLLVLLGCTGTEPVDSAPAPVEDTDTPEDPCDVLSLRVDGEDPPHVGDTWTVWMLCDDALMTGAMRLTFDPPDFARIDENNAEFLYEGDATMRLQVGSRRLEREVTVLAAGE
jgi:hypothetical protein